MPVAVVTPTNSSKKEAQILVPSMEDTGLDISCIYIVIIYNGIHHFIGTRKPQSTFKDGVTDVISQLQQARVICDNLKAEDESVKGVVATTAKTAASIVYNLERLFKPPVPQLQPKGAEAFQAEPLSKR